MDRQAPVRLSPQLRFAAESAEVPAPPDWSVPSPDREVWLDNRGVECAYGQIVEGSPWMRLNGIGDFRIDSGAGAVVVPAPGARREDVVDAFYRTVLPFALQLTGMEALHGSAVAMPQGVVALCAVSETGKSTIACGLGRRGHRYFADDAVVFDLECGRPRLYSLPFAIRLRDESASYFDAKSRDEVRVASGSVVGAGLPLASICLLERKGSGDGAAVESARLAPSEAFSAVLPHAYCFTLRESSRKGEMMRNYFALVGSTPVFRLRFTPGLENLPAILDHIEAAMADLVPLPA